MSAIASSTASVVKTISTPALACRVAHIRMPLHRRRRREQFDERVGAEREHLAGGLRTLEKEQAGILTRAALGELGNGAHTRGARVFEHGPV